MAEKPVSDLLRWYMAAEAWVARLTFPRMGWWLWITIALVVGVAFLARHMLTVLLWKATLLTLAAYLGYFVARHAEKRSGRPHELLEQAALMSDSARRRELEDRADRALGRRALYIVGFAVAAALGT